MKKQFFKQTSILTKRLTRKVIRNYMLIFLVLLILLVAVLFPVLIKNTLKTQDEYSTFIANQYEQILSSVQNTSQAMITDSELSELLISYAQNPSSAEFSKVEEKLQYYLAAFSKIMYCMIETEDGTVFESFSNTDTGARELYMESSAYESMKDKTNSTYYSGIMPTELFSDNSCRHSLFISRKLLISNRSYIFTIFYNVDDYISNSETIMEGTFTDYTVLNRNCDAVYTAEGSDYFADKEVQQTPSFDRKPTFSLSGIFYSKQVISVGWHIITYTTWAVFFRNILIIGGIVLLFYILPPLFFYLTIIPTNQRFLHPLSILTRQISGYRAGENLVLDIQTGDEIEQLSLSVNRMISKINHQIEDIRKKERANCIAQYSLLATQIDPHFIYNTLNSAIYLSKAGETQKAEQLLKLFIQLLQNNMKSGIDGIITTLGEEIKDIETYVELQQIRYPGRFKMDIQADEILYSYAMPRLILQPLIENALNHGVLSKDFGVIVLTVYKRDNYFHILLEDDGEGMDECKIQEIMKKKEKRRHTSEIHSISIENICHRLSLFYKDAYQFEVESEVEKGTVIKIIFPLEY